MSSSGQPEDDSDDHAHFQNMINSFLLSARDSNSPPKVDEASLQKAMDKNKESLKVKLMMRRPINQLVEQGIMPSPKKPLQYLQQCQKLERAQTENILKNLMKTRPDRQALIDHHILEDTTIDPSLQDKQRQLKKARLADNLNDRLSHRPGPLELVKGNILHADETFAQAVKEGQIPFKPTCEGQALRHPAPVFTYEEDSGSDVALSPPQDILDQSLGSMPSVESMALSPYPNHESPSSSNGTCEVRIGTLFSVASPASSQSGSATSHSNNHKEITSSSSTARRKKSKPKTQQPKTRTIKFHEYKGPPSAQKTQTLSEEETSYELLLQQQQLFLQWQLKMQQKYPQVILPVPQSAEEQSKLANSMQAVADALQMKSSSVEKPQVAEQSPPPNLIKNFEDLKVNGLKAECKKRNLPVSGNKVQLLERLRKNIESNNKSDKNNGTIEATTVPINLNGIIIDSLPTLVKQEPVTVTVDASSKIGLGEDAPALMVYNGQILTSRPNSAAPMDVELNSNDVMDCSENASAINEEIVKRQQQKILQLERELERSQRQLQQQQWWHKQQQQAQQQAQQQVLLASHPVPIAPAPHPATVTMTTAQQALVQQQPLLQPKTTQLSTPQQLYEQARKYPPGSAEQQSALVKASLAAFIHNQQVNNVRARNGLSPLNQQNITQYASLKPIVLCQAQAIPTLIEKPRANSLPNGLTQQKMVWSSSVPNFTNVIAPKVTLGPVEPKFLIQKAPPDYNEAVKPQNKAKQEKQSSSKRGSRKSVKSQEVDDVLDVLISHGELPPSAAQDPVTPSTPDTPKGGMAPPAFPSVVDIQPTLSPPCATIQEQPACPSPSKPEPPAAKPDPHPNIVFDLNLDLQELEAMDLGVLDRNPVSPLPDDSSHQTYGMDLGVLNRNNTSGSPMPNDASQQTTAYGMDLGSLNRNDSMSGSPMPNDAAQQTTTYGMDLGSLNRNDTMSGSPMPEQRTTTYGMDLGVLNSNDTTSGSPMPDQKSTTYGNLDMDLGVLNRNDAMPGSLSGQQQGTTSSYGDLDMDVEFTDWLEVLTNNNSVANHNQPSSRVCSYNTDPLMPSMDSGQETLDMFTLDNLDFKLPSDSNLLSWDYAT